MASSVSVSLPLRGSFRPALRSLPRTFWYLLVFLGMLMTYSTISFNAGLSSSAAAATRRTNQTRVPSANTHMRRNYSLTGNYTTNTNDMNAMVLDFTSSVAHTAVFHSNAMIATADVLPFLHDKELPLVVSWRERLRLREQFNRVSALPFPPDLMQYVAEDRRKIFFSNPRALQVTAPQPNPPFAVSMTVDEMKRAVALYQSPASSDRYIPSLINILLTTGVERVLDGADDESEPRYALAPPLIIHLAPCAVPVFTRHALLNTRLLESSTVVAAQQNWSQYLSLGPAKKRELFPSPPRVPRRFIITTTDLDDTPTAGLIFDKPRFITANRFVHALLDHPLLVHWYAQNCNIKGHPKFSCIPIGLNLGGGSKWEHINVQPMLDQQSTMMWSWFIPRKSPHKTMKERAHENPDTEYFTMGGSLRHPADNLQALIERASGTDKAGPTGAALPFEWIKKLKRERAPRGYYEEIGCAGNASCVTVSEDVVAVELLDGVLEEWTSRGSGAVKWVPIQRVGAYVAERYGVDVSLTVRLVAPRLSVQPGLGEDVNTSPATKCERGEWSDPASPPMWCQMHSLGVAMEKNHLGKLELLVPVPAVYYLALQHYRPIGSLEHRAMRVSVAFEVSRIKKIRYGIESLLIKNLGSAVDTSGKRGRAQFQDSLQMNLFAASPSGYGYDCYRTYETLLMGGIPIIFHPSMFNRGASVFTNVMVTGQEGVDVVDAEASLELFADLPVVVVKDYNISLKELKVWRAEVEAKRKAGAYRWEKLFTQHWLEKMGAASRSSE